jgi:hypothetical protein
MRPLLSLPPGYKPVLFWGFVLIVLGMMVVGLMFDPGPNPGPC